MASKISVRRHVSDYMVRLPCVFQYAEAPACVKTII